MYIKNHVNNNQTTEPLPLHLQNYINAHQPPSPQHVDLSYNDYENSYDEENHYYTNGSYNKYSDSKSRNYHENVCYVKVHPLSTSNNYKM